MCLDSTWYATESLHVRCGFVHIFAPLIYLSCYLYRSITNVSNYRLLFLMMAVGRNTGSIKFFLNFLSGKWKRLFVRRSKILF